MTDKDNGAGAPERASDPGELDAGGAPADERASGSSRGAPAPRGRGGRSPGADAPGAAPGAGGASRASEGGTAPDGAAPERPEERDERYLRLAADFENYRRRIQQELVDRSRYGSEDAARALLPVLDNLRRAIEHAPADDRLRDGLSLVVREFESALERLGVAPIEALGAPFDPSVHEAVGGDESDEVDVETVSQELQRGYRLHDRVLRPAMVRIVHPRAG